jgi:alpha-galactosidase
VAVLDVGDSRYSTHPFHLDLAKLGLHGPQHGKNLWTGEGVELTDQMPIEIGSHDVLLVRLAEPR